MLLANGTKPPSSPQPLSPETARSLVDSVEAFLFDCDGVIWKGDKLIEGVPLALKALRSLGKKLVFATNNSRKSRKQYAKKFASLGLDVSEVVPCITFICDWIIFEIYVASFAAAMFPKQRNFLKEKKVLLIMMQPCEIPK
ncbi:phosphoglycolate phosphatase 1A, chloroplastic-like [Zingiber officinale]|uniref:phosphoglycolate phosphatase 1A, chloroplastic-like n=1 Tax=Zingiber officinale TaxID=94328 RepID=UPI001C4D81F3|nr:phosphoglycolate phosphatase 1A, chloroplastic-like [Zingiber officinale]